MPERALDKLTPEDIAFLQKRDGESEVEYRMRVMGLTRAEAESFLKQCADAARDLGPCRMPTKEDGEALGRALAREREMLKGLGVGRTGGEVR